MIFFLLFLLLLIFLLKYGSDLILSLKPLLESALLSTTDLSNDNSLIRREILLGKFLIILSGWFDFTVYIVVYCLVYYKAYICIQKNHHFNALCNSGFKDKLKSDPYFNKNISRSKNSKRKIIWFNPPYSSNVSTNIGKSFLTILDRHFPKSHKLYKVYNRNNVKISIVPCLTLLVLLTHTIKRLSTTISQNHLHQLLIVVQKHLVL